MKIVCTGDWHAFNFTDFSKSLMVVWDDTTMRYKDVTENSEDFPEAKEMSSRFFNILKGICDMRDYCIINKINNVLLAGDVFHKRSTIEVVVFNAIYKVLDSFYNTSISVHIIAGNHDQVDSSTIPQSSIHPFREIAHTIESPEYFKITENNETVEVVALPYSKDKGFVLSSMKELREQCESPKDAILMCHLGITGGTVGSGMYAMSDEYGLKDLMYNKWKYVVCGHYHQPQLLEYNSIYTGTPVQNSFGDELKGEDGYNGFFVVDTNKRWDVQFVPIIAPRFITVSSAEELEQYDSEFLTNNYVRVKASAKDAEDIKDSLEELLGEDSAQEVRLELEKDYATEQRSEIGVSQSFEETVKIYAQERCEDSDKIDYFTGRGLEILSEAIVGGK